MRTRNRLLAPLLAALASLAVLLVASGCGGTSSDAASGGDGSGGKLTLVAYSTPEEAYKELIPAFDKTSEGKGVSFSQSYARLGRAVARRRGRPAGRRRRVLARARHDAARGRRTSSTRTGTRTSTRAWSPTRSSCFVVRKGNPKGIKDWDDLVTGDVEVLEPNPFTSGGASWNIMAAYGAQLEKGKTPEEAQQYLAELFKQRARARQERARGAPDLHRAARATSARATRTRRSRAAEGRGARLRRPRPDDPDREPGRGHDRGQGPDAGAGRSWTSSTRPRPRRSSRARATARSSRTPPARDKFPTPADLFDITKFGGWDEVNDEVLRPGEGHRGGDRQVAWGRALSRASATSPHPLRGAGEPRLEASRIAGDVARPRHRDVVPQHRRADPARGGGAEVARERPRRVLGRDHQPAGGRRAEAHAVASRWSWSLINAVFGHADRLGARPRRVPRQERRQLPDRPAVRAAHDRRRPDAARALRAATARSASTSRTPARRWWWRCCS